MIYTLATKALRLVFAAALLAGLALTATPARAATITLTANYDSFPGDGLCSLREAIIAANTDAAVDACPAGSGADTIILPAGQYDLTLAGVNENAAQTGDLNITEDLTLIGDGSATTTINANFLDRVFDIIGTPVVEISGVTITGGSVDSNGGGIFNDHGTLTLTDSSVNGNTAELGYGGGIFNNDGVLTLTNSSVDGNIAEYDGGGIYNSWSVTIPGNVTITGSNVTGNTSKSGSGGGIDNEGTMTLTDSTVTGNTAELGYGGGISNGLLSDSFFGPPSVLTITNSSINGNTASSGGGIGNGLFGHGSTLTITKSGIDGNIAGFSGGGIYNDDGSAVVIITDSSVAGNTAGAGGGIRNFGSLHLTGNSMTGNIAVSGSGGGIDNVNPSILPEALTVTNSTLSGNTATVDGGGINTTVKASLYNVTLADNTADADGDGLGDGGGVHIDSSGTLNLSNSIVAGNLDNSPIGFPFSDCAGTLTNLGYNLIEHIVGCTIVGAPFTNLLGVSALLGPLQDNGGPTLTHALLFTSPAIDAGDPAGCKDGNGVLLTTDQRGYGRPVDGDLDRTSVCDMGAYEYRALAPTSTPMATGSPTSTFTPSPTPTVTDTPTAAATATFTPSPTPSLACTPAGDLLCTTTVTPAATDTATFTPTPANTLASTATSTFTPTADTTGTPTATLSVTSTPTPPVDSLFTITMNYSGVLREVSIYAPSTYAPGAAMPLVFALHGGGDASVMYAPEKRIVSHAESDGFIAVFPNGLPQPDKPYSHHYYWDDPVNIGYMAFLMDEMIAHYSVDTGRIYFVGFSGGAQLIYELASDPAISARIAGIGTVAGEIGGKPVEPYDAPWEIIDPSLTSGVPMPAYLVQGQKDKRLPADGGFHKDGKKILIGFGTKTAIWQHFTGALTETAYAWGTPPSTVTTQQWVNPANGYAVVAVLDKKLAHQWPKWDVVGEFWSFFQNMPTR